MVFQTASAFPYKTFKTAIKWLLDNLKVKMYSHHKIGGLYTSVIVTHDRKIESIRQHNTKLF
jgi:hypothetical protein